jgi:hypothetical protein
MQLSPTAQKDAVTRHKIEFTFNSLTGRNSLDMQSFGSIESQLGTFAPSPAKLCRHPISAAATSSRRSWLYVVSVLTNQDGTTVRSHSSPNSKFVPYKMMSNTVWDIPFTVLIHCILNFLREEQLHFSLVKTEKNR